MPRLPDFTALGQRPTAQPNLGVTGYDETLTAPGRAMQRLGESVGRIAQDFEKIYKEEERKNSVTRIEDAHNKLKSRVNDLKYGKNGYSNIRGGDVNDDFIPKYQEELKAYADEISQGFSPEEQQSFKRVTDNVNYGFTSDMLGHSVREKEAYKNKVFKDTLEIAETETANNFGSDNAILSNIERATAAAREMGKHQGLSDEIINNNVKKIKGGLFEKSINAALDNNDIPRAKALYSSRFVDGDDVTVVGEVIDPDKRKQIQSSIQKADLRYEAQSRFSEVLAKTSDPEEMLKIAYSSTDGDLQDEVVKRIKSYNAAASSSMRLSQKQNDDKVVAYFNENGNLDGVSQRYLDGANPATIARLEKNIEAKIRAEKTGEGIKTETKDFADLYAMYGNNRGEFNKLMNDPGGPFPGYTLSPADTKRFIGLGNKDNDVRNSPSAQKQIHQAIAQITGEPDVAKNLKGTNKAAKKTQDTLIKINELIDDFKSSHNDANPNSEQLRQILSGAVIKVKKDSFFGGEKPLLDIDGFSAKETTRAFNLLRKRKPKDKGEPTEEEVRNFLKLDAERRGTK